MGDMDTYRELIHSKNPILGKPMRRKLLKYLGDAAIYGDTDAVELLVEATIDESVDTDVQAIARKALSRLRQDVSIDTFCSLWESQRNPILERLLLGARYVVKQPMQLRALTALKVGKLEEIRSDGPEVIEALLNARGDGDQQIARRAEEALHQLTNPATVDVLCALWERDRDPELERILTQSHYVAESPPELRILTALKVGKTEEIAFDCPETIGHLISAYDDEDPEIAEGADRQLSRLSNSEAAGTFYSYIMTYDHPELLHIVLDGKYEPDNESRRALFYFITRQWEKYEILDFQEHRPLLRQGYQEASDEEKKRFLEVVRESGRTDILNEAMVGGRTRLRLAEIGDSEWEAITEGLIREKRWDDMWRLVFVAPVRYGARMVSIMRSSGWEAKEADSIVRDELLRYCPSRRSGFVDSAHFRTIEGHAVKSHSITPDGAILATGGGEYADRTIRLWSLPGGEHLRTLEGHGELISCLSISPDGAILASGSNDRTVRLWSLPDGKHIRTLEGHTGYVECLSISPDGTVLASGSNDRTVCLWSLPHGDHIRTLEGHRTDVKCLSISPDGSILASGSGRTIRLWSLPDGEYPRTLEGHTSTVLELSITPDGSILASGSWDHTVRLWSLPQGEHLKTLEGHTECVECLCISPDGSTLASGSDDNTIRLWSLPDGKCIRTLEGHTGHVRCLSISPEGNILASGGDDNTTRLWSLPSGEHIGTLEGHTDHVRGLSINPGSSILVSESEDTTVRLWSFPDVEYIRILAGHTSHITCVCISCDSSMLVSGGGDHTVRLWSFPDGKYVTTLKGKERTMEWSRCLSTSPDGSILATRNSNTTVSLWTLPEGEHMVELDEYTGHMECLSISPDNSILAIGKDDTINLWRLPDVEHIRKLEEHTGHVRCLSISPDGGILASGSDDRTICLWRLPDGEHVRTLEGHTGYVFCHAISPDSSILASGGWDQTIRLWSLPDGKHIATLDKHTACVECLSITPDGKVLVSGSRDNTVRLWRLPDGECIKVLYGHTGPVQCLSISRDGNILASGSYDRTVRLWRLPWTKPLALSTFDDLEYVQMVLQEQNLPEDQRLWWQFLETLIRARFRHDIFVEERPSVISFGEYDIEIE